MKLYTKEMFLQAAEKCEVSMIDAEHIMKYIDEYVTPIELPSDVEVGKIVLGNSPIMEHRDSGYFAAGAMKYNKWLKEQILNQNK